MEPTDTKAKAFDPFVPGAILLWCLFFLVGLVPNDFYWLLRSLGQVVTQNAMVNRPELITLLLSGYVALFVWQRSREAGVSPTRAHGLALQSALLGLVAFSTLPILDWLEFYRIPIASYRWLIFFTGITKLAAWLLLFSFVLRYYLGEGHVLFERMACVFPSARAGTARRTVDPAPVSPEASPK